MKILKFISFALLLMIATSQSANAQNFVKVNGKATDIAISPKNGSVYVVNADGNVKKYDEAEKKFAPHGQQLKNAKSLSVNSSNRVFIISKSNQIYSEINGFWKEIPCEVKPLSIQVANGKPIIHSSNYKVYYRGNIGRNRNRYKWYELNTVNQLNKKFNQIIRDITGTFYVRSLDNSFQKISKDGEYTNLNGKPLYITADNQNDIIYAVGRNRGIYKWASGYENSKWELLKGTRKDFKKVAVHGKKIWAITTDNSIYYYDDKPVKDYSGTYKVTITNILSSERHVYGTMGVYLESKIKSGKITLKPIGNLPHRVWDVSIHEKQKLRKIKPVQLNRKNVISNIVISGNAREYGLNIGRVREFKLIGEAANKNAVFDFQMNIKATNFPLSDVGKWERIKLKVDDIEFNKEQFIFSFSAGVLIGFKIEKL